MRSLYKVNLNAAGTVIGRRERDGSEIERAALSVVSGTISPEYNLTPELSRLFADSPDRFTHRHRIGGDDVFLELVIDWGAYNASAGLILIHGAEPISATLVLTDADRTADDAAALEFAAQVGRLTAVTTEQIRRVFKRLRIPPFVMTVSINGNRDAMVEMAEVDTARAFLISKGLG